MTIEEITRQVLDLPRHQRLTLIRLLLDIDQPPEHGDIERVWDEEIRARVKAVDEGHAKGISYSDIKQELAARFAE